MIVVTGAAGFIGSNIIKGLNARGIADIIAVDELTDGHKFVNLVDCHIKDYLDKDAFLQAIQRNVFSGDLQAIFHEGAISATTEWDGRLMMENNYEYTKILLEYCIAQDVQFIYASSAAVYGGNSAFKEELAFEKPLNVYGYSKYLLDQVTRRLLPETRSQVVGLRYFNVYGPREQHKGSMASVAFHFNNQIKETGGLKLFEGSDGYGNGEQRRDFVFIDDVVDVNLWFLENPDKSGIFNVGTGRSQPFNDMANAVIDWHGKGSIDYIPFPKHLKGHYQSFTEADLTRLREAGYQKPFATVEQGVKAYLDRVNAIERARGSARESARSDQHTTEHERA